MNIYPSLFEKVYQATPLTLVDVGASGGMLPHWQPHLRHLRVIGFEPDKRAFDELCSRQDQMTRWLNLGLQRRQGQFTLYLTRKQQNSSFFLPNRPLLDRFHHPERFDIVGETTLKCETLDNALKDEGLTDVDFVKLDTQGSELGILEGATSALCGSVFGLEIEVSFAELYKGQPLFANVDLFVRQHGFDLIDLRTASWKRSVGARVGNSKGQLMHADALYFRQPLMLKAALSKTDPSHARSKLLRALSICQIYGFLDYGLELIDIMGSDLFEASELKHLQDHLRAQAPLASRMPNFPYRKRFARLLCAVGNWLAPRKHRAVQRRLGNF
jgi:FkbM family methyltransferase